MGGGGVSRSRSVKVTNMCCCCCYCCCSCESLGKYGGPTTLPCGAYLSHQPSLLTLLLTQPGCNKTGSSSSSNACRQFHSSSSSSRSSNLSSPMGRHQPTTKISKKHSSDDMVQLWGLSSIYGLAIQACVWAHPPKSYLPALTPFNFLALRLAVLSLLGWFAWFNSPVFVSRCQHVPI